MREIKFRAWIKKDKRMLYRLFNPYNFTMFPERYELMQFTGLKDKNGKEIYEGDIVKSPDFIGNSKVIYSEEDAEFRLEEYNIPLSQLDKRFDKVIGNIYENPELLKEKN